MSPADIRTGLLPGPEAPPTGGLEIAWQDNFDGTTLDTSKWQNVGATFNYGDAGGQHLANINDLAEVEVSGGTLKLHAHKGTWPATSPATALWRSGSIEGRRDVAAPYSFEYGQRLEFRVNCSPVVGPRPAIWTANRGGYPGYEAADADGEIDILEFFVKLGQNNYNLIWDYSPLKQSLFEEYGSSKFVGWRTWACEWDDTIRFYRSDGPSDVPILRKTQTVWSSTHSSGGPPTFPHPFHVGAPQTILMTHQIGGTYSSFSWPALNNPAVDPAVTHIVMEVDYIRCYNLP